MYRFVIVVTCIFLTSCTPNFQDNLKLGSGIWPGYEPIFVARDKGFFDSLPIKFVEYRSASQVMEAFIHGDIQLAALTLDEAIRLKRRNIDIEIVWIFDMSHGGDGLVALPNYQSIDQLKGKKIGVESNAVGLYTLNRLAALNNLSTDDFDITYLQYNQHLYALENELVDAVISFEPVLTKAKSQGYPVLFDSKQIPNEIIDVLVVSKAASKNNKELIQQFLTEYNKVIVAISSNFKPYMAFLNQRMKADIDKVEQIYDGLIVPNIENQLSIMHDSERLALLLNRYNEIISKKDGGDAKCNCNNIFNDFYLQRINEN